MGGEFSKMFSLAFHLLTDLNAFRQTIPVLDKHGKVVTLLSGRPNDPRWLEDVNDELDAAFAVAREAYQPPSNSKENRRGGFETTNHGISIGGGQPVSHLAIPSSSTPLISFPAPRQSRAQPTEPH